MICCLFEIRTFEHLTDFDQHLAKCTHSQWYASLQYPKESGKEWLHYAQVNQSWGYVGRYLENPLHAPVADPSISQFQPTRIPKLISQFFFLINAKECSNFVSSEFSLSLCRRTPPLSSSFPSFIYFWFSLFSILARVDRFGCATFKPGFKKRMPFLEATENWCVSPVIRMSTSMDLWTLANASRSFQGVIYIYWSDKLEIEHTHTHTHTHTFKRYMLIPGDHETDQFWSFQSWQFSVLERI